MNWPALIVSTIFGITLFLFLVIAGLDFLGNPDA